MPALTEANDLVRARNVSASECYALLGKHPYSSPQKIFDRLTSPYIVPVQQSDAMQVGSFMEPYIAKYVQLKLGLKLRAATRTIEHKRVPLCATPDYYVLNQKGKLMASMLVEIKVSSIMYGWTEGTLHPHYEYQARAQLACTGRDICIVAALVGSAFYTIPVVRDMEKETRLLEAVQAFMDDYVIPGIRPSDNQMPLSAVVSER